MNREQAIGFLLSTPYKLGHILGFTKLTKMNNRWIVSMIKAKKDKTLQAHRNSYKTTSVSIALAIIILLFPNKRILFMRKTDTDVKEIIKQVQNILLDPHFQYFAQVIYGKPLRLLVASATEITTNLSVDVKGTPQLTGMGIGASLTGKHFDIIFTDDIVNILDRSSKAERDHTKLIYQELQNVKNTGTGRIFNTGTPWHKDDAFTLMPEPEKWDCYSTGIISEEELAELKQRMTNSLFAVNYELKHIASDDVIFTSPQTGADPSLVEQGTCHIDASYGGSDYTAFTIVNKKDGKFYVFGKCWSKHVDDCEDEILSYRKSFNAGKIYCEDNGDKGYLAKQLKLKGASVVTYHEDMNKYIKITSYLKGVWEDVIFVDGTDEFYINQICDYNDKAEHDDCPDSLASLIRKRWANKTDNSEYQSLWALR